MKKQCDKNISDYLLSGWRYMGNMGTALPYCEEKLKEKCKAETIPANFLLECLSPFHFFKKPKVCSAGNNYGDCKNSELESCWEAQVCL